MTNGAAGGGGACTRPRHAASDSDDSDDSDDSAARSARAARACRIARDSLAECVAASEHAEGGASPNTMAGGDLRATGGRGTDAAQRHGTRTDVRVRQVRTLPSP